MLSVEDIVQALMQADSMAGDCRAHMGRCADMTGIAGDTALFEGAGSGVAGSLSAAGRSLDSAAGSLEALRSDIHRAIGQITK